MNKVASWFGKNSFMFVSFNRQTILLGQLIQAVVNIFKRKLLIFMSINTVSEAHFWIVHDHWWRRLIWQIFFVTSVIFFPSSLIFSSSSLIVDRVENIEVWLFRTLLTNLLLFVNIEVELDRFMLFYSFFHVFNLFFSMFTNQLMYRFKLLLILALW